MIYLKKFLAVFLFGIGLAAFPFTASGQSDTLGNLSLRTPRNMWEVGINQGITIGMGDINYTPSQAMGIHIRKALDYVFSIRAEGVFGTLKFSDVRDGTAETSFVSGSAQFVVSLNNLSWNNTPHRRTNLYGFIGTGITQFKVEAKEVLLPYLESRPSARRIHGDFGLGLGVRISPRFNVGIETKGLIIFGNDADQLDGVKRKDRDVLSYSSARLNFNVGNKEEHTEPLYWMNPMDAIIKTMTELKSRPVLDLTDTDGDGVIDLLDQDNNTPPGVQVDTRGIALDSDNDGIPNHLDEEPFIPNDKRQSSSERHLLQSGDSTPAPAVKPQMPAETPAPAAGGDYYSSPGGKKSMTTGNPPTLNNGLSNPEINAQATGGITSSHTDEKQAAGDKSALDEEYIRRIVRDELSKWDEPGMRKRLETRPEERLANWFLPIIHFNIDSDKIRFSDYGSLAGIARVMKSNPNMTLVVEGFTDKTASKEYNLYLSYLRANSAIEHLVSIHGIDRSRFLLNYNGEDSPLVPSLGSTLMNRRVEFRVAEMTDQEMEKPAAPNSY